MTEPVPGPLRPRVIIATAPDGHREAVGSVLTDKSLEQLRADLTRAGWTAGDAMPAISAGQFRSRYLGDADA